ncbi:MAG: hypothetical protein E7222_13195 [Clostridiales bacterium]|nr:hypothetical protein [Clostridiales bacterium]
MAITKIIGAIHPAKSGGRYKVLKNTIDYITREGKTDQGYFVGSMNCSSFTALKEMIHTKNHFGKTSDNPHERLGYHFTISWSPEENISHEEAFSILQEFCERYLGSEYEAVYSVHTDRKHVHGHICFNSVNCETGKKFRYENGDWASKIQPLVDELCKARGYHTLEEDSGVSLDDYYKEHILNKGTNKEKKKKGKYSSEQRSGSDQKKTYSRSQKGHSNNKYYNEKNEKYSHTDYIKDVIDKIIPECSSFEEFIQKLKENGFWVKMGKHIAVKTKGMERFRRLYKLGENYTEEAIKSRILHNGEPKSAPTTPDLDLDKYIFVVPLEYRKFVRRTMTPQEKKYYGRMYYLGKAHPGRPYPTYRDVQRRIREIKKTTEKISFIRENDIKSSAQLQNLIDDAYSEFNEINNTKKQLFYQKKDYRALIDCVNQIKNLYPNGMPERSRYDVAEAYSEAEKNFKELMDEFQSFGLSWEEAEAFSENLEKNMQEGKDALKKIRQRIDFLKEIQDEYKAIEEEMVQQNIPKEKTPQNANRKK